MPDTTLQDEITEALLEIGAVRVDLSNPIRFRSGILSPIYCDNRLLLGHPVHRRRVAAAMADVIRGLGDGVEGIVGTATAGIPHAAWVADRLELPMVYVRAEAKEHGAGRQIEGGSVEGRRFVVVEDLITTGGSSLRTISAMREAGGEVSHCAAIFSYGFREADEAFRSAGCTFSSLTGFDALLRIHHDLTDAQRAELRRWHADPHAWRPEES